MYKPFDYVFDGSRLKVATAFAGCTPAALGEAAGVSRQTIAQICAGALHPAPELVERISSQLGFTPRFFYRTQMLDLQPSDCSFHRTRYGQQDEDRCWATARLALDLYHELVIRARLTPVHFLQHAVRSVIDAEHLAMQMRRDWGLGPSAPIRSVTDVLEVHLRVPILHIDVAARRIDTFSFAVPDYALVVRTTQHIGTSHYRFDVLHELGHLIMHPARQIKDKLAEHQANRFAIAALLPAGEFVEDFHHISSRWDWDAMGRIKRKYGASFVVILQRALQLRLIDRTQYERGILHISRKWGDSEPEEHATEKPRTIRQALHEIAQISPLSQYQLSESLGWSPKTYQRFSRSKVVQPVMRQNVLKVDF